MVDVLFIGHRNMYFGAESVMFRIMMLLKENAVSEPEVILPISVHNEFRETARANHIRHIRLERFKLIGSSSLISMIVFAYNLPALIKLLVIYKKKKVDVIFTNTSVNLMGPLLAFLLGKRHIWHFHEQPTGGKFKWIPKIFFPLYRLLIRRNRNTIIFISHLQKSLWEKEFDMRINNCEIIYTPPLRLNEHPCIKSDLRMITFGFLGSWTKSKNILSLINIFSSLKHNHPDINFDLMIMGAGDQEEEIRSRIKSLKITDSVKLLAHSTAVLPFFEAIDIFVLPSFFESWGLVVLEAIQQRKCVVVTKNTGLTEILRDGEDCIFIDPVKSEELYIAMENLLLNENLRSKMAENAYQNVQQLNLDAKFKSAILSLFIKYRHD